MVEAVADFHAYSLEDAEIDNPAFRGKLSIDLDRDSVGVSVQRFDAAPERRHVCRGELESLPFDVSGATRILVGGQLSSGPRHAAAVSP